MNKRLVAAVLAASLFLPYTPFQVQAEETTVNTDEYEDLSVIVQTPEDEDPALNYDDCTVAELTSEYTCIQAESEEALEDLLKNLENRSDILDYQPNYTYHALASRDTYSSDQWALDNNGTFSYDDLEYGITMQAVKDVDMDVPEAWNAYSSDREVIVALLDTGVDYQHEDLANALWTNPGEIPGNGKDDDGNGYIDDVNGWNFYNMNNQICYYDKNGGASNYNNDDHGTHCAGTIAATANNGIGIAGVASNVNVKILPVKVLGGSEGTCTTANIIRGITYAQRMGAQIVNASWGGDLPNAEDKVLKSAIANSGMLFVCASGNEGTSLDVTPCYPASYSKELDNVISVGSINCDGTISYYSNVGRNLDVLAPGDEIAGLKVGGYEYMSGTSMAAPMVSAIAAMLYSSSDHLYPQTVKKVLCDSYKPLSTVSDKNVKHPGIVSALLAVNNRSLLQTDTQAPYFSTLKANYKGAVTINAKDTGSSGVCCLAYEKGNKTASYFKNGTRGARFTGTSTTVSKSGTYTFYVRDNAGNETCKTLQITVDKKAPTISAKKSKKSVTVTVKDSTTGLKTVKYAYGNQKTSYFKSKGKKLSLNKKGTAKITKKTKGVTIYAKDWAGNTTRKYISFS